MISIKIFETQGKRNNYFIKGFILYFLWVFISIVNSALVFDTHLNPDHPAETEFNRKIEELKIEIREIISLMVSVVPVSHELHDYFEESAGIIEKLLTYVRHDIDAGDSVAASVGLSEAVFLTSFLKEELAVTAIRDTITYREINITQYGLKGDGVTNNQEQLEKLIASLRNNKGHVILLFPEGEYYVKGKPGSNAIELSGLENITFKGMGNATLLFDGQVGSQNNLLVEDCKNLEFRNLSIDMMPVPFTLGTIISVENGNKIVIKICEDYPEPDKSYWTAKYLRGLIRDPKTGRIERDCGDPRVSELEVLDDGKYRLTLDDNSLTGNPNMTTNYVTGHLFSLHPRGRPGSGNSVSIYNSRHLLFSHFRVHAADGHIFFIKGSAGVKFIDCDIVPQEGRIIMNNADGFHCPSNLKGIYLERCRILGMNDDCLNFYAKLASVGEVEDNRKFTLLVSSKSNPKSGSGFNVGDNIAFLNANTGEFDGITTIQALETIDWGGQNNLLRIETKDAVKDIISRRSSGRPDKMTEREYTPSGADNYRAAMAIKAPFEHMVLHLNAKNDGFIIRNCEIGYNRATGFKCKATNGVIRNTVFHDQIVLFLAELGWREGTYPGKIEMTDVTVDRGIKYTAGLPGKNLPSSQVVKYMKYIKFKNVVDASGNEILGPGEIK